MRSPPVGDSYPETTLATLISQGASVERMTLPRTLPTVEDLRTLPVARRALKRYCCRYGGGAFGGGMAALGGGALGGGIAALGGGAFGGGIAAFGGGALTYGAGAERALA